MSGVNLEESNGEPEMDMPNEMGMPNEMEMPVNSRKNRRNNMMGGRRRKAGTRKATRKHRKNNMSNMLCVASLSINERMNSKKTLI